MNTIVGVYTSHAGALKALAELKKSGYQASRVSLMSKADFIDKQINLKSNDFAEKAELSVGISAGSILGLLTGVGIFAIPGLGVLYGAGAVIGVIAGLELGAFGSSLAAIFTELGIDKANSLKYEHALKENKYLVVVKGNKNEVTKADTILGRIKELV